MERRTMLSFYKNIEGLERNERSDLYGLILAGGYGKRLAPFIKRFYGINEPKQFVAFTGKRTMIQHTADRLKRIIPEERQFAVVDYKHRQYIHHYLKDFPSNNLVYQPGNRDTAPGILLSLARVLKKDPNSNIAIFPSDHFILEEDSFMEQVLMAQQAIRLFPDHIVLLGVKPEGPETDYGWIEPCENILFSNDTELRRVKSFHEKPDRKSAQTLYEKGCLWNTLIMVTKSLTLWKMALEAVSSLQSPFKRIYKAIGTPEEEKIICQEYEKMDSANISNTVLQKFPSRLIVLKIKDVFWSDWGNKTRVLETLRKLNNHRGQNRGILNGKK